jgi:hypothetical protein
VDSRQRRREAGAFATPPEIVRAVVAETLAAPLARAAWRDDGSPCLRVLDPAVGDGRFLVECARVLVAAAAARGAGAEGALRAIVRRVLCGVDRDPAACAAARTALGEGADVRLGEALLGGVVETGAFDAVVGNPPYIRSVMLKRADPELWARLRGAFDATSYKEWDLYGAFLERSLEWARPDGDVGLVVPSRWLTGAFAARLRARLAGSVRRIVDFGAEQRFPGATTYTALVYLRRGSAEVEFEKAGAAGRIPAARLGPAPWVLGSDVVERLRGAGPPLGEVARIAKGAGTNADPVFLLERRDDGYYSPALAASVDVEDAALVPCLRGRDIGEGTLEVRRWALFPYDRDRLLPPEELHGRFPLAAALLERCRALLDAREGGRFRGPTFYRWGRPQNLRWLLDREPKIVVPDAARTPRAAIDDEGRLAIDTAYAIRPTGAVPLARIYAALRSPLVMEWLGAVGIPLRGGYVRLKTAYLASLPVP